jgi:dCTP deaminase
MLLGKPEIERYLESGDITIDRFKPENLGSAQYDVTLGEHFYRERFKGEARQGLHLRAVYNPFDESHVRSKWELSSPISHEDYNERTGLWLENVRHDEKLILLEPGEIILGHTEEFVGGSCNFITTMMKARSSLGRNGVEVCRCAGMGDVGYFTRWTMEIVNTSRVQTIALPVGRRVAQLLFFQVNPVRSEDVYDKGGKYQASSKLDELKAAWTPEQMLPKQWRDRECRNVNK